MHRDVAAGGASRRSRRGSTPLTLERVAAPDVPWAELDARPDRVVSQTQEWLDFLVATQGVEPVVARVLDGGEAIGWFTSAIVRFGPVKVLGAPMRGWTTPAMGFNVDRPIDTALVEAVRRFTFDDLGCVHLELADRALLSDEVRPSGFRAGVLGGYELAIDRTDDEILAGMTRNGRRDVRRGVRNGVTVEEVDPTADPGFAAEYMGQVAEAFAKRDVRMTYGVDRVEALIRHLHPAGRLLLLRAHTPDGERAATGLFPGLPGSTAEFWMGGSHREHQHHLPNEVLMWHAIRTWRDRGCVRMNFGGGGQYKAKYGGDPHQVPWLRASRFRALEAARDGAFQLHRARKLGVAKAAEALRR